MRDRLIKLLQEADKKCRGTTLCETCVGYGEGRECINHLSADYLLANGVIVPPCKVVDAIDIETIKSWLYEIAINNVGCAIDGDFSVACEEIISRLDGLRSFARDRIVEKALKGGEQK